MGEIPNPEGDKSRVFENAVRSLPLQRVVSILESTVAIDPEYDPLDPNEKKKAVSDALLLEMGIFAKSRNKLNENARVFSDFPLDEQAELVGDLLTSLNPAIHLLQISQNIDTEAVQALLDETHEAELRKRAIQRKEDTDEEDIEVLRRLHEYNMTMDEEPDCLWGFAWHAGPGQGDQRNKELEHAFFDERIKSLASVSLSRNQIVALAALSLGDATNTELYASAELGVNLRSKQRMPYYLPLRDEVHNFIKKNFDRASELSDEDITSVLKEYLLDDVIQFVENQASSDRTLERTLAGHREFEPERTLYTSQVAFQIIRYAKDPSDIKLSLAVSQLLRESLDNRKDIEGVGEDEEHRELRVVISRMFGSTPESDEENSSASRLTPDDEELAITMGGIIFKQILEYNLQKLKERSVDPDSVPDVTWFNYLSELLDTAVVEAIYVVDALKKRV